MHLLTREQKWFSCGHCSVQGPSKRMKAWKRLGPRPSRTSRDERRHSSQRLEHHHQHHEEGGEHVDGAADVCLDRTSCGEQ